MVRNVQVTQEEEESWMRLDEVGEEESKYMALNK